MDYRKRDLALSGVVPSLRAALRERQGLGLLNNRRLFLTVWRLKSKVRTPAPLVSGECLLLVHRRHRLLVSSRAERGGDLSGPLIRAQIPRVRSRRHGLTTPQRPRRLVPSRWRLDFNTRVLGGRDIPSAAAPCCSYSLSACEALSKFRARRWVCGPNGSFSFRS